ncbi:MAG TPA: glycerophosphodiester phosphodiesterase family protein [Rudaea sp.]|nr:glycerophosphodiester phosphodiesterase family protein [Rudaea sp.]
MADARWNTLDGKRPRIIAHRGASGHRPEHTLEAFALALAQGADMLEPDLVASRDGVLFARHDLGLSRSTDVASRPEFAVRARTIDTVRDWWIGDFDAEELGVLRAVQPMPDRGDRYDGQFGIASFGALLDLVGKANRERDVPVVIEAEIKQPDAAVLAALARELESRDLAGERSPVWIECFDHDFLRRARERCGNPCIVLLEAEGEWRRGDPRLRELARWARGVAPRKDTLRDAAGRDTRWVTAAHELGLEVHAWTFRDDGAHAPFASPREELDAAFALGVDALFCDFPDMAIAARAAFAAR